MLRAWKGNEADKTSTCMCELFQNNLCREPARRNMPKEPFTSQTNDALKPPLLLDSSLLNIAIIKQSAVLTNRFIIYTSLQHCGSITQWQSRVLWATLDWAMGTQSLWNEIMWFIENQWPFSYLTIITAWCLGNFIVCTFYHATQV